MAEHQPGGQSRGEPGLPGPGAGELAPGGRAAFWFPLLLFGVLDAASLPLAVLGSPRPPEGMWLTRVVYPGVTQAMYLGGGSAGRAFPCPLGGYWAGGLVAGALATAAWYRWRNRRAGSPAPVRGYLLSSLGLAVVAAGLPLLAWGDTITGPFGGSAAQEWNWLEAFWQRGTFALLAIAVGLGMLAWAGRSRTLAAITAAYAAAVCLTGWLELQQAMFVPAFYPAGDPAVLLPAAVLLLAGLAAMLAAGAHDLRARNRPAATPPGSP